MKNLKESLRMSLNESKKFKEYDEVEIGDTGEDYNGEEGEVVETGSASYIINTVNKRRVETTGLESCIDDGIIDEEAPAVVVKMWNGGEQIAYVYGSDGFQCYE